MKPNLLCLLPLMLSCVAPTIRELPKPLDVYIEPTPEPTIDFVRQSVVGYGVISGAIAIKDNTITRENRRRNSEKLVQAVTAFGLTSALQSTAKNYPAKVLFVEEKTPHQNTLILTPKIFLSEDCSFVVLSVAYSFKEDDFETSSGVLLYESEPLPTASCDDLVDQWTAHNGERYHAKVEEGSQEIITMMRFLIMGSNTSEALFRTRPYGYTSSHRRAKWHMLPSGKDRFILYRSSRGMYSVPSALLSDVPEVLSPQASPPMIAPSPASQPSTQPLP